MASGTQQALNPHAHGADSRLIQGEDMQACGGELSQERNKDVKSPDEIERSGQLLVATRASGCPGYFTLKVPAILSHGTQTSKHTVTLKSSSFLSPGADLLQLQVASVQTVHV